MLTMLKVLRLLASLVSSFNCHDKKYEPLSDCFKVWFNTVMKWILFYRQHVHNVKITRISKFESDKFKLHPNKKEL